jgi:hypothetical protein
MTVTNAGPEMTTGMVTVTARQHNQMHTAVQLACNYKYIDKDRYNHRPPPPCQVYSVE